MKIFILVAFVLTYVAIIAMPNKKPLVTGISALIMSVGCIITKNEGGLTTKTGVYAGGDAVTGAATVILAMGAGKSAAEAIDEYIKSK